MSFEVHDVDCHLTGLPVAFQHNAWWDAMALRHRLVAPPASTCPDAGAEGMVLVPIEMLREWYTTAHAMLCALATDDDAPPTPLAMKQMQAFLPPVGGPLIATSEQERGS